MEKTTAFLFFLSFFLLGEIIVTAQNLVLMNEFDGRNFEGTQIFGYAVSTAGDINNDGFDDFIVSDYKWDNKKGKVFLFLGGTFVDNAADAQFRGKRSIFGSSIANLGDINGDGFDDLILGSVSSYAGIFFGGDTLSIYPDLVFDEMNDYESFGSGLASAGDVNNDGFMDIIVGAVTPYTPGNVILYLGGDPFDTTPDLVFYGEEQPYSSSFGNSVSSAGDVNNDGFDDIIVGAENYENGLGRAYIYYGGDPMDNIPDVILDGEREQNLHFGESVSSGKDLNNDGFDDALIGSIAINGDVGKAFIYFGGSPMDDTLDVILHGESESDGFGFSVSADDFNGDGYSDALVGAYNQKKAYVYFGGENMDNEVDVEIDGNRYGYFGISVSTAGDVNNDGKAEIVIGASRANMAFLYKITDGGTDVNSRPNLPDKFELRQNYPNPFPKNPGESPTTTIRYSVPFQRGLSSYRVTLKIYNALGEEIATPVNKSVAPGNYEVAFDGNGLPSGVYYYRLQCGNFSETKKMIILK